MEVELRKQLIIFVLLITLILIGCAKKENQMVVQGELKVWKVPNIGEAAEAYFSPDSKTLICNAKREGDADFMTYTVNVDGTDIRRINDKGADA